MNSKFIGLPQWLWPNRFASFAWNGRRHPAGAEKAPDFAEIEAAYASTAALFDGNNGEELAPARAQLKEPKDLGNYPLDVPNPMM